MEKPVLFSGPLVRAILEGRKWQTRRPLKARAFHDYEGDEDSDGWPLAPFKRTGCLARLPCPFGTVGTRLWVRENWAEVPWLAGAEKRLDGDRGIRYQATWDKAHAKGWKPSIHMKREASRLTLEVTDVRVEWLHAITDDDARAEGVTEADAGEAARAYGLGDDPDGVRWSLAFADLWNGAYGEGSWNQNPWVWAVSFKVVTEMRVS